MECTIQSMAEAGATGRSSSPSSMDPAAIPSGKVGQGMQSVFDTFDTMTV